jgi:hypothetical protein
MILARGRFAATFADPASPFGPRRMLEVWRFHDWITPEQQRQL